MRHGEAESPRLDDASRELVTNGIADVSRVAQEFHSKFGTPSLLAMSPYQRTRQTAALVASVTGGAQQEVWEELVPSTAVDPVLGRLQGTDGVFLLTHQPLIGLLTEWLTGESPLIRPATLLVIETEILKPGWGEIECVITA